jgi:hypothetical protein
VGSTHKIFKKKERKKERKSEPFDWPITNIFGTWGHSPNIKTNIILLHLPIALNQKINHIISPQPLPHLNK